MHTIPGRDPSGGCCWMLSIARGLPAVRGAGVRKAVPLLYSSHPHASESEAGFDSSLPQASSAEFVAPWSVTPASATAKSLPRTIHGIKGASLSLILSASAL